MGKKIHIIDTAASAPPKLKRVAAYARVSMETERLNHSLSAQVSYYSELIQKTPGWQYAGVYADEGISGTKIERRPEFQRMLADCEAGKIDIILTKSISRFARNTVDLLNTVRRLRELGIEVRFEKEHINSLSEDGELMLTLLASFAQEESRSISENSKWGIRKQYERGETRNWALYGYRLVDGKLEIDEEEAEVVRRVFQMFLDGDSCYAISQKLTAEGIHTRRSENIGDHVIMSMIRQEKYTGCTLAQKYYSANHITHKLTKNNGELPQYFIEETHPAIIDKETFQAAQEEFARRYGVGITNGIVDRVSYLYHDGANGRHDPKHRSPYWSAESRKLQSEYFSNRENVDNAYSFSRFIQCEGCGAHLWAQRHHYADGSTDIHWVCNDHSKNAPAGTPRPIYFRDSALKEQIATVMGMEEFDDNKMHELLSSISAIEDRVTLHYKDGSTKIFQYIKPRQRRRRRKSDGNSNENTGD